MSVPEHLWRFPTAAAIASLAARFDLPNDPDMQDWEWEVADSGRIDEFLAVLESADLTDDERFTLMETVVQSFEDSPAQPEADPRWVRVLDLIERRIALHIHSVWYWADLENDCEDETWRVAPTLRGLLARHRQRFEQPPTGDAG